jgi:hypothetical protein
MGCGTPKIAFSSSDLDGLDNYAAVAVQAPVASKAQV